MQAQNGVRENACFLHCLHGWTARGMPDTSGGINWGISVIGHCGSESCPLPS